jgi:hypothetical protein
MLGMGKLSTVACIRTATLLLSVHAMQMQQVVEKRENNLASILKCVPNVENGIMQPSILFHT